MVNWGFKTEKPIFMILGGHSGKELRDRWDEFKGFDVWWASMNDCMFLKGWMPEPIDLVVHYCTHVGCHLFPSKKVLNKSEARGDSIFEFILQCEENNVETLVMFGADGYSTKPEAYVFAAIRRDNSAQVQDHKRGCSHFNQNLPKDMNLEIINVSPDSSYELNNMSYDDFLRNYGKRFQKC